MIQGTTIHQLTSEQIRFLNRGPTYVVPCQMHTASNLPPNEILTKQIIPLRQQLTKLFTKYPVDLSLRWNFEKSMQQQFIKSFNVPVPTSIEKRTIYEKQLIGSIHYQLKRDQLILRRTADQYNTYYLGDRHGFNTMAKDYIENKNNFEMIGMIDPVNTEQKQLNDIIKSIDLALDQLEQKKLIPMDYLTKFQIRKETNINLPYLYFLPEITNQDNHITLQPRLSSCANFPMQTLATYLDRLLRPLHKKILNQLHF